MPTTPIYALPYPAATDPADVPTDMQELATGVESALGAILLGGSIKTNGPLGNVTQVAASPVAFPGGPSITLATAGTYAVLFGARMQSNATGTFDISTHLAKAGVTQVAAQVTVATQFTGGSVVAFTPVTVTAGQVLSLMIQSPSSAIWTAGWIVAMRVS